MSTLTKKIADIQTLESEVDSLLVIGGPVESLIRKEAVKEHVAAYEKRLDDHWDTEAKAEILANFSTEPPKLSDAQIEERYQEFLDRRDPLRHVSEAQIVEVDDLLYLG